MGDSGKCLLSWFWCCSLHLLPVLNMAHSLELQSPSQKHLFHPWRLYAQPREKSKPASLNLTVFLFAAKSIHNENSCVYALVRSEWLQWLAANSL